MVSYCYHLAVVKGWWPPIDIILLWSGVGGQLLTPSCSGPGFGGQLLTSCCGQGLVVSYIDTILLWSGVGGQLLISSCRGQGLVVSY